MNFDFRKKSVLSQIKKTKIIKLKNYRLNFISLPNLWDDIPQWDAIRRRAFGGWFDYKGRACMNGISALTKETGELSCLSAIEDSEKMTVYQPGIRPHQASTCWCLDCRLPGSRTVRNKFLSFISHLFYTTFVLAAWADFDTKWV